MSIVVPFYGVERYIEQCLQSLQEQSFTDFEAILVDDGSLDGSLAIAERVAAGDSRFRIIRQRNQGLGPARNTGASHAVGEYLTFVDSDDLVPPYAYERMVGSLDSTGSDMAAGNARRFNDLGVRDSWAHARPFASSRPSTHVREIPALALDRMAWNKVYRRTYWDAQGFEFPAGLYEDYPVTIASHLYADRVDVLATPVYYWRERDGGELSITQRLWEMNNLRERVASAERVLDIVSEADPEVRGVVERHFLHIDVAAVLGALHRAPDEDERSRAERAKEIIDLADRMVRRFDPAHVALAGRFDRIQARMVAEHRIAELTDLVEHRARHGRTAPLLRRGHGRKAYFVRAFPGLDSDMPEELFRVPPSKIRLGGGVLDTQWRTGDGEADDELIIDLRLTLDRLELDDASVQVWAVGPSGGFHQRLPVETLSVGPAREVRVRLCPGELVKQDRPGHWRLEADVRMPGIHRRGGIAGFNGPRTRWSEQRAVGGGLWAKPTRGDGGFGVEIWRPKAGLTEVVAEPSGEIRMRGWFTPSPLDEQALPVIWFRLTSGEDAVAAVVSQEPSQAADPKGSLGFSATLEGRQFASHGLEDNVTERSVWSGRLAVGAEPPVAIGHPSQVGAASTVVGHRRVTILAEPNGRTSVHEEYAHPRVDRAEFAADEMRLSGPIDCDHDRVPSWAKWRAYITPEHHADVKVPVSWHAGERRFEVAAPIQEMIAATEATRADAGDLVTDDSSPVWSLWLQNDSEDSGDPVVLSVADIHAMPVAGTVDGRDCRLKLGRMGRLSMVIADD